MIIVNAYQLKIEKLRVLDLNECGVLAWITEVVSHRGTNQEATGIVAERLVERYQPEDTSYDVIKGYRADDSYTQGGEAFLLNQINVYEVPGITARYAIQNPLIYNKESGGYENASV